MTELEIIGAGIGMVIFGTILITAPILLGAGIMLIVVGIIVTAIGIYALLKGG
ncbi:MAG: hypothetical protein KA091_02635 [Methanoregulaceae archaeon]|jgi:hypothetical protein|nr:hypothetical protein [Methanoregulaceae archaeon]